MLWNGCSAISTAAHVYSGFLPYDCQALGPFRDNRFCPGLSRSRRRPGSPANALWLERLAGLWGRDHRIIGGLRGKPP